MIAGFCSIADALQSWCGRTIAACLLLHSRINAVAGNSACCGVASPQTPDLLLQLARKLLERAVLGLQALQLSMSSCFPCHLHMTCAGQETDMHVSPNIGKILYSKAPTGVLVNSEGMRLSPNAGENACRPCL